MSALSYITKQPLLPVVQITKDDATTYTFNYFTSTFDFRVTRCQIRPPFDQTGGQFTISITSGDGTNSGMNTILNNVGEGNEIVFWIGKSDSTKTKIFRGIIETKEIKEPNKNYMEVVLKGPDWGSDLLKSKLINRSWTQERDSSDVLVSTDNSTLISQIISDLLTDTSSYLSAEFAVDDHGLVYTAANVDISSVDLKLPQFEANVEKLDDKLQELSQIIKTTYYVDPDKNFIMRDPVATSASSGIVLTDDYSETIGSSGNVGLIAPNTSYIRTLENHKRRLFGYGADQDIADQSSETDSSQTGLDANWLAQRFTPQYRTCRNIAVKVDKLGSPTASLTLLLIEDFDSGPNGSTLRTLSKPASAFTSTAAFSYFDMGEDLTRDLNYWIVLQKVGDATNTYRWHHDNTDNNPSTSMTSSDGSTWSATLTPNRFKYTFIENSSRPILSIMADSGGATAKHFHEEVIKQPDITDMRTMNKLIRSEFQTLNKRKEIFKGMVYAPDTLLQTGENVRIRKQQSGYTFDADFVIAQIEYIFESSEDQGTGTFYYQIEATRYTTY